MGLTLCYEVKRGDSFRGLGPLEHKRARRRVHRRGGDPYVVVGAGERGQRQMVVGAPFSRRPDGVERSKE